MALFEENKPRLVAETTLSRLDLSTGPHTLVFNASGQVLTITNGEASADVVVTLDGQGVTTADLPGYGVVTASAGLAVTVAAGASKSIDLNRRSVYMGPPGNTVDVTITGATTGKSFGELTGG